MQYKIDEITYILLLLFFVSQVIIYNTPFMFRPFVSLVLTFVPKEWRWLVHFVNGASALRKHVADEMLPDFLGGKCSTSYRSVPEGARPVQEMAAERYGMSPEQVAKIQAHFERYFSE